MESVEGKGSFYENLICNERSTLTGRFMVKQSLGYLYRRDGVPSSAAAPFANSEAFGRSRCTRVTQHKTNSDFRDQRFLS